MGMKFSNNMLGVKKCINFIYLTLFGHILNPFWNSRSKRAIVREQVLANIQVRYFKRYLSATKKVKESEVVSDDKNDKIFTIWLQGEDNAPKIVKACFKSIRRHCKQELIVLDENTLFNYIQLPDIIMQKRKQGVIQNAHFADICRVELLYKYGGYWLDATGFVTSLIPDWITKQDFFMFLVGNVGSPYSFVQNCFIRARKGSYLLAAWRAMIHEYWINEDCAVDYFMHQLLFKTLVTYDVRAKKYFAKMPHVDQDPTHEIWYAGYKNKKFNKKLFQEITSKTSFQKITYKDKSGIIKGSFADEMINKM